MRVKSPFGFMAVLVVHAISLSAAPAKSVPVVTSILREGAADLLPTVQSCVYGQRFPAAERFQCVRADSHEAER